MTVGITNKDLLDRVDRVHDRVSKLDDKLDAFVKDHYESELKVEKRFSDLEKTFEIHKATGNGEGNRLNGFLTRENLTYILLGLGIIGSNVPHIPGITG